MLYFQAKPDPVFTAILDAALEVAADTVEGASDDASWPEDNPQLARCFTRAAALAVIRELLAASRAEAVYRLTDYHWLILHECLHDYCDIHNDLVRFEGPQPVDPWRVGPIDVPALLDRYFWDTDFLFDPGTVAAMGPEGRAAMGMSDEVFGISQGLPPHPEELKLTPVDEPAWDPEEEAEVAPRAPFIPCYPPPPET